MDVDTLTIIGRAMFGSRWKTEIARELGVSRISVHNWVHKGRISEQREAEILKLFEERMEAMATLAEKLKV